MQRNCDGDTYEPSYQRRVCKLQRIRRRDLRRAVLQTVAFALYLALIAAAYYIGTLI